MPAAMTRAQVATWDHEAATRDAEYIVQACNAFPELVAALEAAERTISTARQYFPKSIHHTDTFALNLCAAEVGKALAKARVTP